MTSIFLKKEDELNFFLKEDELNIFEKEDDLNNFEKGKQPKYFSQAFKNPNAVK